MSVIYVPKGMAREYSPRALNHYIGCDHGCIYCYGPGVTRRQRNEFGNVVPADKMRVLDSIHAHAGTKEQVLLSFLCDPYSHSDVLCGFTRVVLKALLFSRIPVAVLSKGGKRMTRDIDVMKLFGNSFIAGQTITGLDDYKVRQMEPYAAAVGERIEMFERLKSEGIRTFASFEPVFAPDESIAAATFLAKRGMVDVFKIGKMNHRDTEIDWKRYLYRMLNVMDIHGANYYVKENLRAFDDEGRIPAAAMDMDRYNAAAFRECN